MNRCESTDVQLEELLCSKLGLIKKLAAIFKIPREEQDDFIQETYLAALKGIRKLKNPEKINSWIYTIALRVSIKRGKQQRNREDHEELLAEYPQYRMNFSESSSFRIWKIMNTYITEEQLCEMIQNLKPPAPQIIDLRFHEGFTLLEISQMLGMNYNTVKTIENRAMKRLRAIIEKHGK